MLVFIIEPNVIATKHKDFFLSHKFTETLLGKFSTYRVNISCLRSSELKLKGWGRERLFHP